MNVSRRTCFGCMCVTEHIGSRNLNRLMAVEIKEAAERESPQERRIDSGPRKTKVVGSKSFQKEQTLSKSFKKANAQHCQIRTALAVLTILKTRPKQLDFKLKIEQTRSSSSSSRRQQSKTQALGNGGKNLAGIIPQSEASPKQLIIQQGCHCHYDTATRPTFTVASHQRQKHAR